MIIFALFVLYLLAKGMGIFDQVFYFPIEEQPLLEEEKKEKEYTEEHIDMSEEHRNTSRTISRESQTIEVIPVEEDYHMVIVSNHK
jgi:hypothetical protein